MTTAHPMIEEEAWTNVRASSLIGVFSCSSPHSELKREGAASLKIFLEMCAEKGIELEKNYSGRLMLRIPSTVHASAVAAAAAHGKSLNQWASEALLKAAHG